MYDLIKFWKMPKPLLTLAVLFVQILKASPVLFLCIMCISVLCAHFECLMCSVHVKYKRDANNVFGTGATQAAQGICHIAHYG